MARMYITIEVWLHSFLISVLFVGEVVNFTHRQSHQRKITLPLGKEFNVCTGQKRPAHPGTFCDGQYGSRQTGKGPTDQRHNAITTSTSFSLRLKWPEREATYSNSTTTDVAYISPVRPGGVASWSNFTANICKHELQISDLKWWRDTGRYPHLGDLFVSAQWLWNMTNTGGLRETCHPVASTTWFSSDLNHSCLHRTDFLYL